MTPSFVSHVLGIHSPALAGGLVFLLFGASAVAQIAGRAIPTERALIAGCALLVVGMAVLVGGLLAASFLSLIHI